MALRNGEGQRNFTAEDIATLTEVYAPYGARLMAILRHTTQNLPCLNTERGEQLRQRLEQVSDILKFNVQRQALISRYN